MLVSTRLCALGVAPARVRQLLGVPAKVARGGLGGVLGLSRAVGGVEAFADEHPVAVAVGAVEGSALKAHLPVPLARQRHVGVVAQPALRRVLRNLGNGDCALIVCSWLPSLHPFGEASIVLLWRGSPDLVQRRARLFCVVPYTQAHVVHFACNLSVRRLFGKLRRWEYCVARRAWG